MTIWKLISRSLRFHSRAHFGVVVGAAIGSAALTGALVVGDSVRGSLRAHALARVGQVEYLLPGRDRLFSDSTNTWARSFGNAYAAGLELRALASAKDGASRANLVDLYGVEGDFFRFAPAPNRLRLEPGSVLLNRALASQLGVAMGDEVLLRFRKPSIFSADTPISPKSGNSVALRLKVQGIISAAEFGEFSPNAGALPSLNAFCSLGDLQKAADLSGRANFVVLGATSAAGANPVSLGERLARAWGPQDAGLDFVVSSNYVEIRSKRVFLDPPVVELASSVSTDTAQRQAGAGARDVPGPQQPATSANQKQLLLTYLVNLFRANSNSTPYSMVTAAGPPYTPPDLRDDEIVVSRWLADDLQVQPGDSVQFSYFLPDAGATLAEATNTFRIRSVVPLEPPYADRSLMPDFPGIEKAESTSDWDAGFPLVHKIRPKDEEYWKKYRGTPKAFITLAAGQKLWANRFGSVTAIRFPFEPPASAETLKRTVEKSILERLRPDQLGLRFEPIRHQALQAVAQAQDFGQLFLGFSLFLVVAAVILMALLFQFGLEQRATEVGTLLALGFTPGKVRRLLWSEAALLGILGGLIGMLGALAYARAMLFGLTTIWSRAVGGASLHFSCSARSLLLGMGSATGIALATVAITLRRQARQPARALLAGDASSPATGRPVRAPKRMRFNRGLWIGCATGVAAVVIVLHALTTGRRSDPEAFFSAGTLFLLAGLGFSAAWLHHLRQRIAPRTLTLAGLGTRGCVRRGSRSLATIALLASGCFLIVAVGAFHLDANDEGHARTGGTGGFTLLGQSTLPIVQDLNSKAGREFFGLNPADFEGVSVVSCRVREGDEASCLNLNHPQQPRLLGVRPESFSGRFTFTGAMPGLNVSSGWALLKHPLPADEIPAIADANSLEWALHLKLGDSLEITDERGLVVKLRLVGAVANSILQGSLIIDEAAFVRHFPGIGGYRMFLLETPDNSAAKVSAALTRALQDAGLELTPALERLSTFNAVQNTYLATFQVLGGLGLLLGCAGLGIIVLRNVLERRGELGLMLAVGFRRRALIRLFLAEHGALLGLGLVIGALAALVAILPAVLSPATRFPYLSLLLTLAAVLLNGLLWTWLATRYAMRGDLLAALRNE